MESTIGFSLTKIFNMLFSKLIDIFEKKLAGTLNAVIYGNNKFVIVGNSGTIVTSTDGVNWTLQSPYGSSHMTAVIYENNYFYATRWGGGMKDRVIRIIIER